MRQHIKKIPILYEKQIQTHTAPGRKARRKVEGTTHVCLCIALIENCKSFAEENASASQAARQSANPNEPELKLKRMCKSSKAEWRTEKWSEEWQAGG